MKNKVLLLGLLFSFTSFAQNVLINGDFSNGLSSWTSFLNGGVNATINATNNEANITGITGAGGATWHVQLNQEFTAAQISSLTVGSAYKVSFDARSNVSNRQLRMFFGQNGGGFVPVNITDVNLTDQMTNYEVVFTVNATYGAMKLGFEMGLSNAPVWIDNVVLEPFVGPVAPPQPTGFVASNTVNGNPVGSGEVFLACGGNQAGVNNIVYRLFYAPTASAPGNPLTATEHPFGTIVGDNGGNGAFGFTLGGLIAGTGYTFWLYQYNTSTMLYSTPAIVTVVSGGTLGGPNVPAQPVGFVATNIIGGSPAGPGQAFLSCGPNNVASANISYQLYYSPTASAPVDPTTATQYTFGTTAGDGGGNAAFGFVISGLDPSTDYTFWLYQYNSAEMTLSPPAIATVVSGALPPPPGDSPTTNAPNPTCPAADVVSVYGDFYPTNIATNYNPNWGQSGSVNPNFDPGTGNPVLAYTNFNYQGTVLTQTDLSSMEFLTFDIWTDADPTATILQVSPINQGGVAEVLVTVPFVQGEWTTIELPKAAFTGMTWNAVKELKFAANGPGSAVPVDIYLDNIFFSTCGTPIPVITGDIYINDGAFAPGDFCTAAGQDILAHDGSPALPFASLAYALTRSEQAPGDVIYIDAGNYNWGSTHNFTTSGTASQPITIQGKGSATNVTSTSTSATSSGLHFSTGSHWVVKDLNWTASNARTVLVEAAQGITLDNCNFNYLYNATGAAARPSIWVNNAAGQLTIKNCNISRNSTAFHMIQIVAGADLTMQDNTVTFPAVVGVGTASSIEIASNSSSVIIIERNKFINGGYGIGTTGGTVGPIDPSSVIQNNFFKTFWGLVNTHVTGLKVYHNSFYTNGDCIYGVGSGSLSGWDIQNNILYTYSNIRPCVTYTSTAGVPAVLNYNHYYSPLSGAGRTAFPGTILSFNDWQNATGAPVGGWEVNGQGGNAASFNPLFVNVNTGDLQVQLGSPAIDAGNDVGVTDDINGTARPLSGSFDIGAHEFLFIPPAPTTNAPIPTCPESSVVSVYGSTYPTNIATNYNPNWGQSGSVNPNFDPSTGNPVLAYTNFNYQGTELTPTNLSAMEFLRFDVYTAASPSSTILQVSPINQGTGAAEVLVTVPFVQGQWTSIALPKSAFVGMTWDNVFQLKFAANGPGSTVPADIYLDNIYFSDDCVVPVFTELQANFCGAVNVTMDMPIRANNVNAPEYRFKVTGANNNGLGWDNNSFVHDSPNRAFKFAFIPGSLWGETYSVEVAVGDGNGNFGPYGVACNVTLINDIPTTQLEASFCGATGVDPNTNLLAIKVTGSTGYRFQVNGPGVDANTVVEKTMGGGAMRKLKMNEVAGILQGEIYTVEIAIRDAAGNWGAYGTACNVTLIGTPEIAINNDSEIFEDNKTTTLVEFGANASHNPFTTEFGLQVLNANDQEPIAISIYDMSGKLIERNVVNPMDMETARFGTNLSAGMYMIEVRQGSNQAVIRQVKN